MSGGRFNPPGVPALYTSLRFETAWLEAQQGFAFKAQPLTLCAYEADCEDILDLTEPPMLAEQGIELGGPWQELATRKKTPPSWSLAERLIGADIAGILVPSFAYGATAADVNAVFWRWQAPPHMVRLIDDQGRLSPR